MKKEEPERIILACSFWGPYNSLGKVNQQAKDYNNINGAGSIFTVRKTISWSQEERIIKENDVDQAFIVFKFCCFTNEKEAKEKAQRLSEFQNGKVIILVVTGEILWPEPQK